MTNPDVDREQPAPPAVRAGRVERWIRRLYWLAIFPLVKDPLRRQRLKLLWYGWGYAPLLTIATLSIGERLSILRRFVRIDRHVLLAHLPSEMTLVASAIAERRARVDEVVVEAGCWQGGSSTKLSILCKALGYRLLIFDSFEGVEALPPEQQAMEWDYAGQYASPESVLRENLARYGEQDVCEIYKGWFSHTLALGALARPVRAAYLDCDLGSGTREALTGVVPRLAEDGWIFSQDYHIEPVRRTLHDPRIWAELGRGTPTIIPLRECLAAVRLGPAGARP